MANQTNSTRRPTSAHALEAEARLYDYLFTKPNPDEVEEDKNFTDYINPNSLEVLSSCRVESSLAAGRPGDKYQFERQGYFCVDPDSANSNSADSKLVFNRSVSLKDTWAKIEKTQKG